MQARLNNSKTLIQSFKTMWENVLLSDDKKITLSC